MRTVLLCLSLALVTQDPAPPGDEVPRATSDETTPIFERGLELQRKGHWKKAQRAFEQILEKHPESVHFDDAELRGGDNAFLGAETLYAGGPSKRRIDVVVMGDGFTIDTPDQKLEARWAQLCLDVLFNEAVFDEYRSYFNFHFARLASLEEGVDPKLSPEERKKIEERNKRRRKKKKTEYSTALDCKAAGPAGQVRADPKLVRKWMGVAEREVPGCSDDGLAIAFARFGRLGMGGGGIANVGRPDKSVTVHEFGHAFVGLLDEYMNQPGPPTRKIRAANAATTDDPEQVPWAHFLAAKVKGVGVFEGGATYRKGVWRPARSCAMNSAGNNAFCPVCREAAVLRVYSYIDPIDAFFPATGADVTLTRGEKDVLSVTPMAPETHDMLVEWWVGPAAEPVVEEEDDDLYRPFRDPRFDRSRSREADETYGRYTGGMRRRGDRSEYDEPPSGALSKYGKRVKGKKGQPDRQTFLLEKLEPGRWSVTARVRDTTEWVLKDDKHLLEQRCVWTVEVAPKE